MPPGGSFRTLCFVNGIFRPNRVFLKLFSTQGVFHGRKALEPPFGSSFRRWRWRWWRRDGWPRGPSPAGELDKLDTSLKLIPDDAAFYSSMMRNREQFEAIAKSNAWAKIMEMPVVQMGLSLYNMQLANPDSSPAKIDAALKNPEMRKILDLLADMASDEVFVYGDKNFVDFMKLFQIVNGANSFGPLKAADRAVRRRPTRTWIEPRRSRYLGAGGKHQPDRRPQPGRRIQAEEHRSGQGTTHQARNDRQHHVGNEREDQGPLQEDQSRRP